MYKNLGTEAYNDMTPEERIEELRKWMTDELDNHKSTLRAVTCILPEADSDIEEVFGVEFKELPKMLNDYHHDTAAHAILKYRLENNLVECDDVTMNTILNLDMIGEICVKECQFCENEEDMATIRAQKSFADDMIILCQMFGFEDLRKSFTIWRP